MTQSHRTVFFGGIVSPSSLCAKMKPRPWCSWCCSLSTLCLTPRPHGLQPARVLCPPLPLRVCSSAWPLCRGCCLTIPFSAAPISFFFPSFPASGSFPMSWLFTSSGQSIGASASILAGSIQGWVPFRLIGPINHHKLSRLPDTAQRSGVAVWGLFFPGRLVTCPGRQDVSMQTGYHRFSISKMLLTIAVGDCSSSPLYPC